MARKCLFRRAMRAGRGFCVDGRWVFGNASIYRSDICLWPALWLSCFLGSTWLWPSVGVSYDSLLIPDSWLVLMNMHNFIDAIRKYAVSNGRASRKEYWMYFLFYTIFGLVALFVGW